MTEGFLDLPAWGIVVFTLVSTHVTIAAVTIYLHRHQAHRALELHPVVAHFFRFWLWLTTAMNTREWVAVHRKHHAACETEDDPHSPQVAGIRKVLLEGSELYRAAAAKPEIVEKYGFGTPDDWLERNLYLRFRNYGVALLLVLDLALFGLIGLTVWAVQMLWIPVTAAGIINGVGHYWGYRNYEVPDASRNIVPWGIIIGGEELHNNHHAHGSSAKLSSKWWEFDIGWLYIRLFSFVGLARVKKVAPKPVLSPHKDGIDLDTVRAVVNARFQVLSRYARDVVTRVYRDEVRRGRESGVRPSLRRARALLIREESLMDEQARARLQQVLSASERLQIVYDFKQRLQAIWKQSAATQEHLVQALQEWCRQAEATGIKALEDFARSIRRYTSQPA